MTYKLIYYRIYCLGLTLSSTFEHDKNGNDRWMPYYQSSSAFYSAQSKNVTNGVTISFKKVKEEVYEIIPSRDLDKGEYAFWYIDKFYCFSVK